MRALVVGQAPSADTDGRAPFSGRSGRRLASLLGEHPWPLSVLLDVVNLVDRWPGSDSPAAYPRAEARAAARAILAVTPHDRLVLCGRLVAEAFDVRADLLTVVRLGSRAALVFPHPSGRSRWWNDADRTERAARAIRGFVAGDLRAVC